jgi:hypothetical protein
VIDGMLAARWQRLFFSTGERVPLFSGFRAEEFRQRRKGNPAFVRVIEV